MQDSSDFEFSDLPGCGPYVRLLQIGGLARIRLHVRPTARLVPEPRVATFKI